MSSRSEQAEDESNHLHARYEGASDRTHSHVNMSDPDACSECEYLRARLVRLRAAVGRVREYLDDHGLPGAQMLADALKENA